MLDPQIEAQTLPGTVEVDRGGMRIGGFAGLSWPLCHVETLESD